MRLRRHLSLGRQRWALLLVVGSATALAQQAPITITVDQAGSFVIEAGQARVFPMNDGDEHAAERERFKRHALPRLLAAADAGAEPANWQVGFFHLFGWLGVPVDAERGRRELAWAPPNEHAIVAWALARSSYEDGRLVLAEELVLEAFDTGLASAPARLCFFARNRSRTARRPPRDLARAEQLLSKAWPRATTNGRCNLALATVRYEQRRFSEAFDVAAVAFRRLDLTNEADLKQIAALRVAAGFRSGRLSEIPLEEFTRLVQRPNASPWVKWGPWIVLVLSLLFLIGWTWARRARPVGLMLASSWFTVAATGNGLGLLLPLPLPLGPAGSRWAGTVVSALACALAFRLRAPNGLFGNTARPIERGHLRLLGASFVGAMAFAFLYESLWAHVFGAPMKEQFVTTFLRVSGPLEMVWTFAAVAILIPYVEEVCFRGFLFEGLDARWGPRVAVIGSALIFGLIHVELVEPFSKVPMITVLGFLFALLRLKLGDLRLTVGLHCGINTLAVLSVWTS